MPKKHPLDFHGQVVSIALMYRGDTSGLGLIRNQLRPFLLSLQHSTLVTRFQERERMYHGNVMSGNAHNTTTRKLNMHQDRLARRSKCLRLTLRRPPWSALPCARWRSAFGKAGTWTCTMPYHDVRASQRMRITAATKTLSCAPRRVRITAAQRDGATAVQPCEDKHGTAWYRTRSTLAMPAARHTYYNWLEHSGYNQLEALAALIVDSQL